MNITRVQIHLIRGSPQNKLKAFADIIIDDEFIIKGLAIREDAEGYSFVTMPFKLRPATEKDNARRVMRQGNEVREDVAHPISEDCRRYIQTKVLDAYEDVLNKIAT